MYIKLIECNGHVHGFPSYINFYGNGIVPILY